MNPLELALARANAYRLFSRLFLEGVTEKIADLIRQIPDLSRLINFDRGYAELAADHYSIFVHNLPPYASIFLEENGQPGGDISESAAKAFRDCGYRTRTQGESADHFGHLLGCLSFLCGAESDAWEDGVPHVAGQMRQIQAEILEHHILPWLYPFFWGIRSLDNSFYKLVANLTVDILTDHYKSLGNLHGTFSTPLGKEENLGGKDTKLKEIVEYMLRPARSGLWLSPAKIHDLGRDYQLPRGFGDRQTTLSNLLKAAGKYESFTSLMDQLSAEYAEAHVEFENIRIQQPELAPFLYPWSLKIGGAHSVFHRLAAMWKENTIKDAVESG
ncbi:MAG: molecular chaperone TorD family protein [Chloroflexota bacterium]